MNDVTDQVCFSGRRGVALKLAGVRNQIDSNGFLNFLVFPMKKHPMIVVMYDLKMFHWKQEHLTVSHI